MAGRLDGKIALVTGIGAGIGQGVALMFAREGATVIGCDISPPRAEATLEAARNEGLTLDSLHPIDLTKPADVERYVGEAARRHGHVDILVNAAAITPHTNPVADMAYETEWVPTLRGEVDLVFLTIKAAWPHMVKKGGGSIINFASVAAFRGSLGLGMVAHTAAKGAILSMSRQVAIEGGSHDIRCNTIAPGLIHTAATAGAIGNPSFVEQAVQRTLIKRIGQPEDIAYCAVYLASDESKWVTGGNFPIDGGVTAV